MGIVKYSADRKFNISQAVKDGWDIEYLSPESLHGLSLVDRKRKDTKAKIESTDWMMGILVVNFVSGGWQCLDHCIEQFELVPKTILTEEQKQNWNWGQDVELEETVGDKYKRINKWLTSNGYRDTQEFFSINKF